MVYKDFKIIIDDNTEEILEEVYKKYGQFSSWKLRDMTLEESPWLTTPRNEIIQKSKINEYFKKNIS